MCVWGGGGGGGGASIPFVLPSVALLVLDTVYVLIVIALSLN